MKRIPSFDLARGFTVLMITPIHTVMLYSKQEVHTTLMGKLLAFTAEGPGAQLFMLLMGIYFSFQQAGLVKTIVRSALLLATGYALNVVKFIAPLSVNLLPDRLLADLRVGEGSGGMRQLFLLGDILHFAALAQLVLYMVRRCSLYSYIALALSITICWLSPVCWDAGSNDRAFNYFLQLATGQPPQVFFPLMPWLAYPLAGLVIGYYFQKKGSGVFASCGYIGIALLITGFIVNAFLIKEGSTSFYRALPADTLQHLGIVFITLTAWDWLHQNVASNYFFQLLQYMSRHITQVYLIQWIIICWMLPFYGYRELDFLATLMAIAFTTGLTFFISVLINLNVYVHKKNL